MTRAMKTRTATKRAIDARRSPTSEASPRREIPWAIRESGSGKHPLQILESPALAKLPWLVHGFSTKPGGDSKAGAERVLNLGFTEWDKHSRVEANRVKFTSAVAAKHMRL